MSRRAKAVPCPRCGRVVLVGDDADVLALPVRADPVALDRDDELRAVVAGQALFLLDRSGCLTDRSSAAAVHGRHSDDTVLAEHDCPVPAGMEALW